MIFSVFLAKVALTYMYIKTEQKPKCVCVCVCDKYLYNVYIEILPIYNTVRRTIISEARAFSREDSRQKDEIEKKRKRDR